MSIVPQSVADGADYAWELATLYPEQGAWSEGEYLSLTDGDNRRIGRRRLGNEGHDAGHRFADRDTRRSRRSGAFGNEGEHHEEDEPDDGTQPPIRVRPAANRSRRLSGQLHHATAVVGAR